MRTISRSASLLAASLLALGAAWTVTPPSELPPSVTVDTKHTFDALDRVTNVARQGNGHSKVYQYDSAGNIGAAVSTGRSSAQLTGQIIQRGNLGGRFEFDGVEGEPVTLRLEANPREAGIGKWAEVTINGKSVVAALPPRRIWS